jgi:uncharacterized membrane protein
VAPFRVEDASGDVKQEVHVAFCASASDVLVSGPPAHMSAPHDSPAQRARVLDVLRLLAIFQMVQGHTIDAVLDPAYRSGLVHGLWQGARGLTSVAFLFLAGVGFAFATRTERGRSPQARARRMRRAGMLIAVGYALRAPFVALLIGDATEQAAALQAAVVIDVLQCIGVTLLVLEGLRVATTDDKSRVFATVALGALLLVLGPFASELDPSGPLRPLLAFFTSNGGSLFPLVPWAGHALLGAAIGPLFFESTSESRGMQQMRLVLRLSVLGGALVALGMALASAGQSSLGQLARLGSVLLVAALLVPFDTLFARWPSWLMSLAQHSLLIYLLHVVLAYGQGIGLSAVVGRTLAPWPSIFVAVAMLALSAGAALAYDALQRRSSLAARAAPG